MVIVSIVVHLAALTALAVAPKPDFSQDTPRNAVFCASQVTVDEVERRSGLNFFHALSETEQTQIEGILGTLAAQLGCMP